MTNGLGIDFHGNYASSSASMGSMRSLASMEGLYKAETGGAMVQLNPSGFSEGHEIGPDCMSPAHAPAPAQHCSLERHGTVFAADSSQDRTAHELKVLLGNSHFRVKHNAMIPPNNARSLHSRAMTLEQAKSRSRVEIDLALQNDTCVQGSYLSGHIKVCIRKSNKKESPVMIAGGKLRIVGFESLASGNRHKFYQDSASFLDITPNSHILFQSEMDADGFSKACDGIYKLPFSMHLAIQGEVGTSKGTLRTNGGPNVQYIALITIKVKDADTDRRSVAHFYRICNILPRLNPSEILAAATRPISSLSSKGLFMGGNGKVKFKASLHRLNWVAGQRCYLKFEVNNDTKKLVKKLVINLICSLVVYAPDSRLDAGDQTSSDPDACRTSTSPRCVAETVLEVGDTGTHGYASAKGWWSGVGPGEWSIFSHYILLPPDALSIPRSKLVEVTYTLRARLSCGSLGSEVTVSLPIQIVNFISMDPPPFTKSAFVSDLRSGDDFASLDTLRMIMPNSEAISDPERASSRDPDNVKERIRLSEHDLSELTNPLKVLDAETEVTEHSPDLYSEIDLHEDMLFHEDNEDVVQYALSAYDAGRAPTFSDLYLTEHSSSSSLSRQDRTHGDTCSDEDLEESESTNVPLDNPPLRPLLNTRKSSSFAERVQEKLQLRAAGGSKLDEDRNSGIDGYMLRSDEPPTLSAGPEPNGEDDNMLRESTGSISSSRRILRTPPTMHTSKWEALPLVSSSAGAQSRKSIVDPDATPKLPDSCPASRPNSRPNSTIVAGNSVKDKIKELEERLRAEH